MRNDEIISSFCERAVEMYHTHIDRCRAIDILLDSINVSAWDLHQSIMVLCKDDKYAGIITHLEFEMYKLMDNGGKDE